MQQDYFGIELSGSICLALPLEAIVKVTQIKLNNLCFIPGMAPFWLGVINYQGSLVWVLDTNYFFNLVPENDEYEKNLTAVILKYSVKKNQRQIALIVNKIRGILNLNSSPSLAVSSLLPSQCKTFIQDTTIGNGEAIDILDLDQFFQVIKTAHFLNALT